jgi:hypothetical protein
LRIAAVHQNFPGKTEKNNQNIEQNRWELDSFELESSANSKIGVTVTTKTFEIKVLVNTSTCGLQD